MTLIIQNDKWTRRSLLKRVGRSGAAALLPFVPIMEAGAQQEKAIRCIQWFSANAANNNNGFWQTNDGATQFPANERYAPLNRHKEMVSVVSNIHLRAAEDTNKNPHNDTSLACITGYDGVSVTGTSAAEHSSLDQIIANDMRSRGIMTPYKSLVLGAKAYRSNFAVSKWQGRNVPIDYDPRVVFDRLFNASGSSMMVDTGALRKRESVLDYVRTSINQLKPRISLSDREKLDQHLTSVEEVERRLQTTTSACNAFDSVDRPGAIGGLNGGQVTEAFVDLMVAAFTCDLTRVVAFQSSAGHDFHDYRWVNGEYSGDFHAWTHGLAAQAAVEDRVPLASSQTRVKNAMTWRSEMIATLMDKLKAVNDIDGTLLDNSGILWWTETSRAHSYNNATWMIGGRMGGNLTVGQRRNYNGADSNKVLTTIARAAGVDTNRVGASKYQAGTLEGIGV